jgi:sugar O-acyltransferase (sialic acid O-acetyltransferase NeuD family)
MTQQRKNAKMKKIHIVGAGGFGREVLGFLKQHPDCGRLWEIAGFVDDNATALDGFHYKEKIVSSISDYTPADEDRLVCALGLPEVKKNVCPKLLERGATFMTFVHPTAIIGEHVSLGIGCVLAPFTSLTADVTLGDFVTFNTRSGCGHDVRVGAYSTLSPFCDLTGGVILGEGVFMGSHATVIPKRRLGDGAHVGAGSVVATHLRPGQRVFGVPAKTFGL